MYVRKFRTWNMDNPLGIDQKPYFSWIIESEQKNVMQTAYQLVITNEKGTVVWDTGIRKSSTSAFVPYEGAQLESCTRYQVKLKVWDNYEEQAEAEGTFETAFLKASDWKAKWAESPIKRKKGKKGFGKQYPATMFRKEFCLSGKVKKARAYVTSHGIYRLSMNGERIEKREFAPEHTVYEKYLCYQVYDITDALKIGENVIGMYVGDGWYMSPYTLPNIKKMKHAHAVLFQLEIEYEDGEREEVCSDEQVKAAYGPVRSSDLFDGELYDATQEQNSWDMPGFADGKWQQAITGEYSKNNLRAQLGNSVEEVLTLKPKEIISTPAGETVIDFGQNIAGRLRVHITVPKGNHVSFEHCEVLDEKGNFFNNIMSTSGGSNGCQQKDVYISNGKPEIYEPYFTFHGFRYVRVTGIENPKKEDFEAVVLSSEKENAGSFCCSEERLNRLYENIRWSQRANMLSIPTDCPQREKAGWTGDIQIYAATALENAELTTFLTRWLANLSCDQGQYGEVPIVVPYDGPYPFMGKFIFRSPGKNCKATSAGWGDAAVLVPYEMYKVTGNKEILKQQYSSMKKWCDYIIHEAKNRKPKHSSLAPEVEENLWDTGFHYGEWLIPSLSEAGLGNNKGMKICLKETPKYTAPIFGWLSVSRFAEIAEALDKTEDAKRYSNVAEKMKKAIQTGVIQQDGTMPAEFMGAYVLPLYFELVPEHLREKFVQHLKEMIQANDGCLDTGFLATPYLLDTLCKNGCEEQALQLFWQNKQPSWMFEVEHGATTIWESWCAYNQEGQPTKVSMNHYAFGCVADWMFRTINGIRSELPGFRKITICPYPDRHLTYAKRSYESTYGTIVSDWKMKNDHFQLHVEIPCNTTAEICLPDGTRHEVGSGSYDYECRI